MHVDIETEKLWISPGGGSGPGMLLTAADVCCTSGRGLRRPAHQGLAGVGVGNLLICAAARDEDLAARLIEEAATGTALLLLPFQRAFPVVC